MFTRIFSMFIAVILLLTAVITGLSSLALRDQQTSARLDELTKEAREIAYLAAQSSSGSVGSYIFGGEQDWRRYISWKAERVNQDYGAYILVVDRYGRVMDNMRSAYAQNPALVESLNSKEISEALVAVLGGEEISLRTMIGGAPTFTVGVPFIRNEYMLGAVFIQTAAQEIEGDLGALLWPVLSVAALTAALAAAGVFVYVRSIMKPIRQLKDAAVRMSSGDFAARVEVTRPSAEVEELSKAFNSMADELSEIEQSRREFVANVSHELRSPITSIMGYIQGMEDGTIPPEEHGHYLTIVSDETRRLSKLIGDLLALSRLERDDAALTLIDFDICEMLRRVLIRRLNDIDSRRMEIECDFEEDSMLVHADADRMEQVVVNLLDNAIKFTPEGGRITLKCRTEKELCLVTVKDNGVGILPEDRAKIFDRFFTADRAHTAGKGTGLGLSICQRILQMHGQTLRLEDTTEGAAFTFTLEKAAL